MVRLSFRSHFVPARLSPSLTRLRPVRRWLNRRMPGPGTGLKTCGGMPTRVVEMQSEGGAIATVHGALQTGALSTSFTSSQGLLLMIPAAAQTGRSVDSVCAARCGAYDYTHALSIFGDHFDVMAVRRTGIRNAVRQQRSGSTRLCANFANGHPEKPGPVYSFL